MSLLKTIQVGDRTIDLHKFTGEVVDEKKWATTQVSGSGGGYNVGSGQQNPVTISSTTTTHDQFFLKNDNGQEMAVQLANYGLALRKGHRVSVIWGIIQGQGQGPFLAVYNHSTATPTTILSAIQNLAVPPMPTFIVVAWAVSLITICFYGIGIIAVIILAITRRNRKRSLLAQLQTEVNKLLADCAK